MKWIFERKTLYIFIVMKLTLGYNSKLLVQI
jgi:hypothetical protein